MAATACSPISVIRESANANLPACFTPSYMIRPRWRSMSGKRSTNRITTAVRQDLKSKRLAHHSIQIPSTNYRTRGAMHWR